MKTHIYNKVKFLSNSIPISSYIAITNQKRILPFYHTITDKPKAHLKHLNYYRNEDSFRDDLNFYLANYRSVALDKIDNYNNRVFHLSFDDGLSEVYETVIPLLLQKNIHGTFFINSDFVDNKKMFYKHRVSLIMDVIKNSESNLDLAKSFLSCDEDNILNCINHLTDSNQIGELEKKLKIDIKQYLIDNKPYLTSKQLIELKNMGFTIGNHSQNHPNFRDISFDEQKKQVIEVNRFLKQELDIQEFYFSFPFGDENIKNEFFNFMHEDQGIIRSFGVSGLKKDEFRNHLHRIPMEIEGFTAEQIIKFEYFYYVIKSFLNKNTIKRNKDFK